MTTANFTARRLHVPAFVTAAVAAWFVLASGTALAETNRASVASSAQTQIALTPKGTMKLTIVAARPEAQLAMTPEGSMKLTVVAQRPRASGLQTAAFRGASQG